MASMDGPTPTGTDGSDFAHRQTVADQYKLSAKLKSRLKLCIFAHSFLFLVMCAKFVPDMLDRLDIFVLEIEELAVPKPNRWEWLWWSSMLFNYSGLTAVRRNRQGSMQFYLFGQFCFGLLPTLYAGVLFFNDVWEYGQTGIGEGMATWQGYPVAIIWYGFVAVAFQVHVFSLLFGEQLLFAWKSRGGKKVQ